MTTNQNNVVAEDPASPADNSQGAAGGDDGQYEQQTVQIPLSACPSPPKPNDMLSFKVVSVDQDNQTVNAVCVDTGGEEGGGGSDSLAQEFNQQQ